LSIHHLRVRDLQIGSIDAADFAVLQQHIAVFENPLAVEDTNIAYELWGG
jgi:hypothetical protein